MNPPFVPDLNNCDSEPIHLLGEIQQFGFLLTVNADWVVIRASENVTAFIGLAHDRVVGQSLETVISPVLLHDIRGCLQLASGSNATECLFARSLQPEGPLFDIAVHQSGAEVVLEFEPASVADRRSLLTLRTMMARTERQSTRPGLYREAARQIRALIGFDRVMVYRFDDDGAGEVVGESSEPGLTPFLGLRYPAADIPAQARALYQRNHIRIISDVDAVNVPVLPLLSPEQKPLDLSMSLLRSVSPIHIEYLKNMGVRASMSISLLLDGKLWGLIACHHNSPITRDLETRSTAEMFGRFFSYILEMRSHDEEVAYSARASEIQNRVAFAFAEPGASLRNMPEFLAGISDFIAADGIGMYQNGEITLTGLTPTRDEFLQVVKFLNKTASSRVFATACLSDVYPPAADFVMRAAGLLAIPISRIPRDQLVFFRREVVKTVTWAGKPEKNPSVGPNGPRLTPRKSFEAWQESVHNRCERWSLRDQRAAEALRITLVELVLRLKDDAEADRAGSQQHQEILIAELNHRVRNILGLVRGLVSQSSATAGSTDAFVRSLNERIRSLARSHDLLTSNFWKPPSFHALLRIEASAYENVEKRLSLVGPDVRLQPKAFTAVALIVHELFTNARKYGALSAPAGMVAVETSESEVGNISIGWRETGGPMVTPPKRRGFGSTLLEQIIPFELNGSSHAKFLQHGLTVDLVLPAIFAEIGDTVTHAPKASDVPAPIATDSAQLVSLLRNALIVEDNLFIANDAEDMLRELGAGNVVVAKSVGDALGCIASQDFSLRFSMSISDRKTACLSHALFRKSRFHSSSAPAMGTASPFRSRWRTSRSCRSPTAGPRLRAFSAR